MVILFHRFVQLLKLGCTATATVIPDRSHNNIGGKPAADQTPRERAEFLRCQWKSDASKLLLYELSGQFPFIRFLKSALNGGHNPFLVDFSRFEFPLNTQTSPATMPHQERSPVLGKVAVVKELQFSETFNYSGQARIIGKLSFQRGQQLSG